MMEYISNLKNLVVDQVDEFITNVMYSEPNEYVTRHDELLYSYNNKDVGTDSSGSYLIPGTIDPKKKNSNTKFIHTTRRSADNKADGIIFVDVPLLYESKFDSLCDKVICVYLNKETQIKRLMERDHIDYSYAKAKIASQMDLDQKRDLADYVIDSKGSFQETYHQVLKILVMIKGE